MNGWKVDDRVSVDFEGEMYPGTITEIKNKIRMATVRFDDGDVRDIHLSSLQICPDIEDTDEVLEDDDSDDPASIELEDDGDFRHNPPKKGSRGMHHYPVSWNKEMTQFNVWAAPDGDDIAISDRGDRLIGALKGRSVHFYGMWSKTTFTRGDKNGHQLSTAVPGWTVWMWARVPNDKGQWDEFVVESLNYEAGPNGGNDPREDAHSLNSDICAAIRKWFFFEVHGDGNTVMQLARKAHRPSMRVPSLQWLDRLMFQINEVRTTALTAGGQRHIVIDTGVPGDPVISLQLDFTAMAMVLAENDNRVPKVNFGGSIESVVRSKGKGPKQQVSAIKPSDESVRALRQSLTELNARAKNGDESAKAAARKVRGTLRLMGVKGGARSGGE